jgi:hypothetical protein
VLHADRLEHPNPFVEIAGAPESFGERDAASTSRASWVPLRYLFARWLARLRTDRLAGAAPWYPAGDALEGVRVLRLYRQASASANAPNRRRRRRRDRAVFDAN